MAWTQWDQMQNVPLVTPGCLLSRRGGDRRAVDPHWHFPPQLLVFLALFGVGLYFMCHISVGLDQELALPKVSCALYPQSPGRWEGLQHTAGGWPGSGACWGYGTAPRVDLGRGLHRQPQDT